MQQSVSHDGQFKNMTDNDLVKRIVDSNDSQLFAVLYDRYVHFVYNRCIVFVKIGAEAEDLTHDIFVKLFVKLRTFKGESKFSSWLYSFVYNHCVNYVTRNQHKKSEFATDSQVLTSLGGDVEDEKDYSDEDLLKLKSDKLAKAMQLIPPQDKQILLLKYQDDFSINELQEVLKIKQSAVKMRLKRAKSKLIKVYETL